MENKDLIRMSRTLYFKNANPRWDEATLMMIMKNNEEHSHEIVPRTTI